MQWSATPPHLLLSPASLVQVAEIAPVRNNQHSLSGVLVWVDHRQQLLSSWNDQEHWRRRSRKRKDVEVSIYMCMHMCVCVITSCYCFLEGHHHSPTHSSIYEAQVLLISADHLSIQATISPTALHHTPERQHTSHHVQRTSVFAVTCALYI